jgi:Ser/Thr protein kinase RdoA (MazF antagonist)
MGQVIARAGCLSSEPGSALAASERLLRTPPPDIGECEAEAIALRCFGRPARATALSGERDRNFLLTEPDGRRSVLKICNGGDDAQTRALQNGALLHVRARDPLCPTPEVQPATDGRDEAAWQSVDGEVTAVLISHLPGRHPVAADLGTALRHDMGRIVQRLSRALSDYDHPAATRPILWDLMLAGDLRGLVELIPQAGRQPAMRRWLERFAAEIRPAAAALPWQAIHNDLSLSNTLVDPARPDRVIGIIDFGDIVRAPRVNEFAIAASYFISAADDPATAMAEILAPPGAPPLLTRDEIALLPDLMRARLATRILLSGWRATLFPQNRDYIMRSNPAAWALWDRLDATGPQALGRQLISHIEGAPA